MDTQRTSWKWMRVEKGKRNSQQRLQLNLEAPSTITRYVCENEIATNTTCSSIVRSIVDIESFHRSKGTVCSHAWEQCNNSVLSTRPNLGKTASSDGFRKRRSFPTPRKFGSLPKQYPVLRRGLISTNTHPNQSEARDDFEGSKAS